MICLLCVMCKSECGYWHFLKYQLSALNISSILVIFPEPIKPRTDKILVIGNRLWSNIDNRLSAKFNRYAIPGFRPLLIGGFEHISSAT